MSLILSTFFLVILRKQQIQIDFSLCFFYVMVVNQAYIKLFGELTDFVHLTNEVICIEFKGKQSAKHIIESLGVPHTEIKKICVNKQQKSLSYILKDGDHVDVYPWSGPIDFISISQLEYPFILDNHLGKLAIYLRMLGINTLYKNDYHDDDIIRLLKNHQRILLTRDRRLLMRREVNWGYCIRQDNPANQLYEVVNRFNLRNFIKPFSRCLKCNQELEQIDKSAIIHRLKPLTKLYYEEFFQCQRCDQIYWKGSHYEHMLILIQRLLEIRQENKEIMEFSN